jgi:transcriptional regulator with XRE-family HTH domain
MADAEPADWKAVGSAVYLRRVELGMERQQDLAERAGVHLNTIGRIERGVPSTRKNPTWPKIEAALQWPVGHIGKLAGGEAGDSSDALIPESAADGIRQAVRSAIDAVEPNVTVRQSREIADAVVLELQRRGLLAEPPAGA